jgi:Tol biopolymer transport system component
VVLHGRPLRTHSIPAAGGRPKPISFPGFPRNALPSWSPDGTAAAFYERDGLYVSRADGREHRRVVSGSWKTFAGTSWSPDGKQLVFGRVSSDFREAQLWVINADGSGLRLIAMPGLNFDPSWQRGTT